MLVLGVTIAARSYSAFNTTAHNTPWYLVPSSYEILTYFFPYLFIQDERDVVRKVCR